MASSAPRFPSRSRHATTAAYLDSVYGYAVRITFRELYRQYKAGEPTPTHEELREWLESKVWPKIHEHVGDYQESGGKKTKVDGRSYARQIENAVTFCLANNDPEAVYLRAVNGGKYHKPRGPKWTIEDLRPHDGKPAKEQMALLGVKSDKTIKRLRRELREAQKPVPGPLDYLLDEA